MACTTRFIFQSTKLAITSFMVLVGVASVATAQSSDPIENAFQGEAALGNAYRQGTYQNMIPQGAPMQSQTYQLPAPAPQPQAVTAPNPYVMQHQQYYYGNGTARGTVHLNPDLYNTQQRLTAPPPPPPRPVYRPMPNYQSRSTFTYHR
jgi:hypothetical protein